MAVSFWCDKCNERFFLLTTPDETAEEYIERIKTTIQAPCECGKICEPCKGQYKDN